ncbi:MAG TPA: DoxX family membrane protein [Myxococcales bacterium]|jgi:uncharacterized membrane protein YphA (DoxX/SURF4 family)|nr:DoxX family membrane protein [Myxococcales bacterium]
MSNGLQLFLALLRIAAGLSILGPGLQKLSWFRNPGLEHLLASWASHTDNPAVLGYLHILTPHAAWLARAVVVGEVGLGSLLLIGFVTPLASMLSFLMVLNFHFASGKMVSQQYLLGQDGLVYLLVFLVLLSGRAGLAFGVDGALRRRYVAGPR